MTTPPPNSEPLAALGAAEPMIEKDGLTGNFHVVVNGERHLLHPLLCAAMDVARNHWDEVLDLHYERQGRMNAVSERGPDDDR